MIVGAVELLDEERFFDASRASGGAGATISKVRIFGLRIKGGHG